MLARQSVLLATAISSVLLSVCLSHVGTPSRRMKTGSRGLHCEVAKTLGKLPNIWGFPLIFLQRPRCPLSVSGASCLLFCLTVSWTSSIVCKAYNDRNNNDVHRLLNFIKNVEGKANAAVWHHRKLELSLSYNVHKTLLDQRILLLIVRRSWMFYRPAPYKCHIDRLTDSLTDWPIDC